MRLPYWIENNRLLWTKLNLKPFEKVILKISNENAYKPNPHKVFDYFTNNFNDWIESLDSKYILKTFDFSDTLIDWPSKTFQYIIRCSYSRNAIDTVVYYGPDIQEYYTYCNGILVSEDSCQQVSVHSLNLNDLNSNLDDCKIEVEMKVPKDANYFCIWKKASYSYYTVEYYLHGNFMYVVIKNLRNLPYDLVLPILLPKILRTDGVSVVCGQ